MAGLAGQKVRTTDSGYTGYSVGQQLSAADVPGGAAIPGTRLLASQG